jgi:hypothetical protein
MSSSWKLTGTYFEACNCEVACPCVFLSAPSHGDCTLLVAWHIEKGQFGALKLDGFNAALAAHSPGHMLKTKWEVALYTDRRADPEQTTALQKIFGGQVGGAPAALAPLIGKVLGARSVEIDYKAEGKKRSLSIPNIAKSEIQGLVGQDGADVTVNKIPMTAVPGEVTVVGKSTGVSYHDFGMNWQFSERNGFYSPFNYNG